MESHKRKVEIHTLGENITIYATMKSMEELLGDGFFRCHRGYLVNLAYVAEYGTGAVRLKNGECVPGQGEVFGIRQNVYKISKNRVIRRARGRTFGKASLRIGIPGSAARAESGIGRAGFG